MRYAWQAAACCATIPGVIGAPPLAGPSAASDADLVERALAGEASAREMLYRRHVSAVAALLVRLLGCRSDAEDAVQDTFVTAFVELPRLRDREAVRAWLMRIAVHQAHRRFRRRRLRRLLGLDRGGAETTLAALAAPGTPPETRAELAFLDRVLAALPPAQRIAWMLRHVEGYELEAVARACGCSLATAKRRIQAAQARVSAHLDLGDTAP